ncbi:ARL14 effector protein-like [Schistocerca piceifrons]|uniref:ARL14 effector protein-like n=1 Tax=Schistocerca piceifrons TaxID=274613 RepID=UPI001F5E4FDF|nr:ARL14 effector protein-like [Schistocerca piceifrons]XP_047119726.1 ARL14 effector protein-like [Schistocerca piceifrons]
MERSLRALSIDSCEDSSNLSEASNENTTKSAQSKSNPVLKKLTRNQDMKFMENFNPETSNREKRKLTRKISHGGRRQAASLYDDRGIYIATGKDLCDCLDETCVGCHFPCPKCRSNKCGQECRVNRKFVYEQIEIEGTDIIIKNKFK